jgi:hypothetical protein
MGGEFDLKLDPPFLSKNTNPKMHKNAGSNGFTVALTTSQVFRSGCPNCCGHRDLVSSSFGVPKALEVDRAALGCR